MRIQSRTVVLALAIAVSVAVGACGDDDQVGTGAPGPESEDAPDADPPADDPGAGGLGGGGGELVLGDETIPFERALCYLEEQEAAAGGGTIELTAQGHGTNAAGEELSFDFTRYSTDSMFAGDDISLVIGDFRAGDDTQYSADLDIGEVERDGNTLHVSDITLVNLADGSEVPGSFRIDC